MVVFPDRRSRIQSSLRSLPAVTVVTMLVSFFTAAPAAADDLLPLGKTWLPADTKPLMPKPFGISLVSMHLGETLDVSNLGLTLAGQKLPPGAVSLPTVSHTTHITGVGGDMWLLPFLDLHGLIGHVSGTAHDINPIVLPGLLPIGVTIPSSMDYGGTTYAAGATLAMAYRYAFALYDFTYSWSSVDLLSNTVTSTAQGVRAGVRTNLGGIRAAIYGGAFDEDIHGPLTGTSLIPMLKPNFSLTLTPQGPWNALVGANLEFTSRFIVTTEVGLGQRKQFLISPGVRF
jgi:hypothetical protein